MMKMMHSDWVLKILLICLLQFIYSFLFSVPNPVFQDPNLICLFFSLSVFYIYLYVYVSGTTAGLVPISVVAEVVGSALLGGQRWTENLCQSPHSHMV